MNDFERAKTVLKGAEYILVGGGSGLSAAAGLILRVTDLCAYHL